jgi:hypothetical protein
LSVADGNGSAIYNVDVRFHSRPSLNRQMKLNSYKVQQGNARRRDRKKKKKNQKSEEKERFCQPSTRVIQISQSLTETRQNSLQISICDGQPASQHQRTLDATDRKTTTRTTATGWNKMSWRSMYSKI